MLVSGLPVDVARVGSYLGYLNREVLRPVTLSVHVYSVRRESGADYELGLSAVIERLLGSPLQVVAGVDSVAVIKPGLVGEDTFAATVDAMNQAGTASRVLRTASCWKTIIYQAISKTRSALSSITTTTAATTRASRM